MMPDLRPSLNFPQIDLLRDLSLVRSYNHTKKIIKSIRGVSNKPALIVVFDGNAGSSSRPGVDRIFNGFIGFNCIAKMLLIPEMNPGFILDFYLTGNIFEQLFPFSKSVS